MMGMGSYANLEVYSTQTSPGAYKTSCGRLSTRGTSSVINGNTSMDSKTVAHARNVRYPKVWSTY
jgi:hypothetical protein